MAELSPDAFGFSAAAGPKELDPSAFGFGPGRAVAQPERPAGGLVAAAKQAIGSTIKGAGQAASDFIPGVTTANPVTTYGQGIIDANPTAVQSLGDIVESPWMATKEAIGNAAGSMAGMVGSALGAKALGGGLSAVAPFTGPAAPVVGGVGKLVSTFGPGVAPIVTAALPSYGGIREEQIKADHANEADARSKAIAALGAGTVGAIETRFGPQDWALSAMKKGGIEAVAKKFADAKSIPGAIGKGILHGGAVEGAEELVQNPIEQLASYQDPTSRQAVGETLFGGAMGALGGGALGGGMAGVAKAMTPEQPVVTLPGASPTVAQTSTAPTTAVQPNVAPQPATVSAPIEINPAAGPLQAATVAGIQSGAVQPAVTTNQVANEANQVDAGSAVTVAQATGQGEAPVQEASVPAASGLSGYARAPEVGAATFDRSTTPKNGGYGATENSAQPVVAESANAVAPTITPIGLAGEASAGQAATNTPAAPEIPPVSTAAPTTQTKQAETAGVPTSLRGEIQSNANQTEEAVTPASGREAQPAAVSGSGVAPAKTDLAQRIGAFVAKAGDVRLERLANNANPALSGAARAEIARRAGMSPKSVSGTSGNPAGTSDMENDAAALATQAARLRESASRAIGSQRAKLTALADRMDAARSAIVAQSNAPAPKKSQVGSRQSPIMRRNDLVGAIMRVTGGNGIASVMAQDIAGDKAGAALSKLRGLFTNRGVSDLSDVAMLLREEEGFDVRDGNHLAELIRRASSGDVAVSMERAARDADADQEKRHRDRIRSQAKKYGVKTQFVKFSDLEARVLKVMEQRHDKAVAALDDRAKKRFDAELERSYSLVSEDEVDAVLVDVNGRGFRGRSFWNESTKLLRGMNDDAVARQMEEAIDAAVEGPEPDWLKDDDGRGNQPTGGGDEADRGDQAAAPGFGLAGQSAEDVARQEADRVAAEKARKAADDKAAAEKKAADDRAAIKQRSEAAADTFVLGGDAMQNLSGQKSIFDAPPEAAKPTDPLQSIGFKALSTGNDWAKKVTTKDGATQFNVRQYGEPSKFRLSVSHTFANGFTGSPTREIGVFDSIEAVADAARLQVNEAERSNGVVFEQPSAEPSAQPGIRTTSGSHPEAVPPAVLSRIKIALNRLREVERELTGVERARGRGHILALEVRDQQSAIKGAQAKLAEFRKMAPGNNIDAEAVIASMGGEPDFSRFGKPAEEVIADSQDYEEGDEIAFTPHAVSNLAPSVSGILTAKQSAGNGRFRLTIRTDKKAPQGGGNVTVTVYSQNGKVDRIGDGLNKPQKPAEPEQRSVINQAFEDGQRKAAEAAPARGETGASLTKEQRRSVLKTLVDVYRKNQAPREMKGIDSNGNERYGYVHSPEYFVKSDITGAMVRYYVTLPDGKIAHPTELFADYTQSDIDAAIQEEIDAQREKDGSDKFRLSTLESRKADNLNEANRKFNAQNPGRADYVPAILTDGEMFIRTPAEMVGNDLRLLGDKWKEQSPAAAAEKSDASNTEDSGSELTYNRRNRLTRGLKWEDIADKDEALRVKEATKAKVYPRPDYKTMIESGMRPQLAHVVKQVYDSIAASPRTRASRAPTDEDIKNYIAGVNRVMDAAIEWAEDADRGGKWLSTTVANNLRAFGSVIDVMSLVEKREGGKSLLSGAFPNGYEPVKSELMAIGGNKVYAALQPSGTALGEAIAAVKVGWPEPQEAWQRQGIKVINGNDVKAETLEGGGDVTVWFRVKEGGTSRTIGSIKIDGAEKANSPTVRSAIENGLAEFSGRFVLLNKFHRAVSTHATDDEAKAAARALVSKASGKQTVSDKGISVLAASRTGIDRRMPGEDISSDRLRDTFKFKGVNFGNWMKGDANAKERQLHLNHAYDSFMDLADVLGVPPEAMSLNGMLGVAIGAQGNGGRASAHFVPGVNEINLTRQSGAGSLAHEWGHALDHYFARQAGMARATDPFLTERLGSAAGAGIRPEIVAKFDAIVQAMRKRSATPQEREAKAKKGIADAEVQIGRWLREPLLDRKLTDDAEVAQAVEKIKAGDLGDGTIAVSSRSVVRPAVHDLAMLVKKKSGKKLSVDTMIGVNAHAERIKYLRDTLSGDASHVPQQMVQTKYLDDAVKLDAEKGGKKYWSTNLEMFARAFDAFVSDALESRAAKNTYLSHAGRSGETVPTGAERTAINEAIKGLVDAVETKAGEDGNVVLFSFAGQQSATADKFQLDRAQQLLADGADAEAVRQQTGWFKGADEKWRYEIDDSGASLKAHGFGFGELLDAIGKNPKLADVLDHPALFAAYPSIAGASVEAFDEKSQNNGELVANKGGGFTIRVNAGLGEAKALSVLLHEIQHGIQNVEGFASGGSPDTMASFDNPQIRTLEDKISALMASSKPGKQVAKEVAEINAKIADLRRENPYSAYRRLAGEVEARNVQARRNFSADRRKYANPDETADTARADVIVVFNGKAASSAPAPANARPSTAGVTGVSPADSAIYSMAQEGKSAAEILSFIGKASRRPFNRYLANALRNLGAASTITLDSQGGFAFGNRSYAQKYAAAYNPKTDTVALFTPREAERHVLHELVHGATLKAIANGGPASMRMRALFRHVQKSGALDGQYGMSSLDEFVAEAFSNPKFQQALKAVQAPKGSTLKSAWQWFVQAVARILGLRTAAMETALDRAMTEGAALMRENAELAGVAQGSDRYAIAWHGTPHVWAPEPGFPHGRPRLDKMGSGEGAQAYGWGWYSAESRGVADEYAGKLSKPIVSFPTGVDSAHTGGLSGAAKEVVKRMQQIAEETKYGSKAEQAGKAFFMAPESVQKELSGNAPRWNAFDILDAGNLYQLDIPDDVLPSLLDWDKPLSEQSPNVQEAINRLGLYDEMSGKTGEQIYNEMISSGRVSVDYGPGFIARNRENPKRVSERLARVGIVGNRYLDGNSRADGKGTYNYVIWDQPTLDRIALLERNGEKLVAIREADAVRFSSANPDIRYNIAADDRGGMIEAIEQAKAARGLVRKFRDDGPVDDADSYFDAIGNVIDADKAVAAQIADLDDDGFAVSATTRDGRVVTLTKSAKRLGSYQVTMFGKDGLPWGDTQHDSKIGATKQFVEDVDVGTIKVSDGIRFNIAADWPTSALPQAAAIRNTVANAMRSDANTSWITPFNTQYHKAEKWAAEGKVRFKRVFDLVQRFLGDVSKFAVMAQNEAPTLFHEWRTLADVKRTLTSGDVLGNQHRADVAAIASPLYEGTLYGGGNPLSGIRWSDEQLRDRFKLTARQIKLYHEALAAVKVSMDEMAKSIVAQHAKRVGVDFDEGMSLEDMVADVSNRMEELQDEIRFQFLSEEAEESVAASVEHYLEMDMEEEAQKTRANFEKQKKAAQAQIEQIDKTMEDIKAVESKNVALQQAGYFPLMRFGKHTVTAKDADGKVQFFGMYEGIPLVPRSGQYEANKVAAELRAEFPEWTVTTGIKNDEKYKLYQGLNIEAIQLFADHMDKEDLEPFQEFIRLATNNRSAQRRLLHRQGTPGFDRDVRRTLAQFVVSNARATSSNYHTQDMLRAAADAEKDGGDIGAEAVKLVEYVRNPAEEAQALRGFLFFNFLGGSLASAAVNLTQTPMMTLPFLSKFESVQRVTRRLMAAAKMAAGNPESLPAGKLRDALLRAEMDGVTAPQEIHQLTATAANNIFAGSRLANGLLRGWGAPFAMAESFNRRIAFIAAFQIAESMSPAELAKTGFKDAFEFAEDAVKQTQGIYNKGNRMNVGRGSVGSVLMTFKQYSIMYLELLKRLPPKQRAIMVGVLLLAAGGGGLPGVEDVEDLIDTIGQWLGFATNSRRALRNTLTEWVGRDGSDIVLNGLLSRMGIDLHSRMGMQNLIPGSGILKQSSVDKGRDIEEFFGPAASVVKSLGDALESLATGHPGRAGMALAPGAVRNVVQGAKMAATGYAEDAKGRRTVPVNELESAAKMVGFNPKSVADYGTVKRDIAQDQRLVGVKREEFTSAIADAILSGDTEARKQAMSDMAQWNRDNPTLRFTIAPGAIVRRVKEARTEGATRFLKAVPKGMRSQAIEEMRQ